MDQFWYVTETLDGKSERKSGVINASSRQDAEKQVKAMFPYPVIVSLTQIEVLSEDYAIDIGQHHGEIDLELQPLNTYYRQNPQKDTAGQSTKEIEMRSFSYTAKSVDGSRNMKNGIVEAPDKETAIKKIKAMYSYKVDVTLVHGG